MKLISPTISEGVERFHIMKTVYDGRSFTCESVFNTVSKKDAEDIFAMRYANNPINGVTDYYIESFSGIGDDTVIDHMRMYE